MASDLLKGVNIKVQPRSGFDKSRKNILTTKVGTLTPILSDLVIPNSDVSIKMAISAQLPPLSSDTFMRCSLKVEGFFCPLRLLYGGFESWLTGYELYNITSATAATPFRASLPRVQITGPSASSPTPTALYAPGSLADYLGVHMADAFTLDPTTSYYLNVFPFLAYHRIYDDWYRNTKIQTPVFIHPGGTNSSGVGGTAFYKTRTCPYMGYPSIENFVLNSPLQDGVQLGELRQRNFGVDYFTSATPTAQKGSPMTVGVSGNAFSISALRSANSIQQWEELQNLSGSRIQDYVLANYGAKLSGGIAQRAIYLGSADYPIYSKGIYATADPGQSGSQNNNPFGTVGAKYGSAYASGTDFVLKGHFDEPGILMVLVSLVPEVNYATGVSPLMMRFTQAGSQTDLPTPMLQNVGNEPIATSELDTYAGIRDADPSVAGSVFGYVPRYTWFKTGLNEVHGLLLDGQSLESFVAQRSFGVGTPSINSNFLQIPTNFLDQVTLVNAELSQYGVWIDSFIQYYVSMPLSQYSVPSLQNPAYEHGVNVHLQNNGSKID